MAGQRPAKSTVYNQQTGTFSCLINLAMTTQVIIQRLLGFLLHSMTNCSRKLRLVRSGQKLVRLHFQQPAQGTLKLELQPVAGI